MPKLQQNIDLAKRLTIHQTERQFNIITGTDRKTVQNLKLITMDIQVAKSNPLILNIDVDFSLLNMHYEYHSKITLSRQQPDTTFLQETFTEILINGMLDLFTQSLTKHLSSDRNESSEDIQKIAYNEGLFDLYVLLAIVNQNQIKPNDQSDLVEQYLNEHKDNDDAKNFIQPWLDYYQKLHNVDLNNPINVEKLMKLLTSNPVADWTDTFSKFKELLDETDTTKEIRKNYNTQTGDNLTNKQFNNLCIKFMDQVYGQPIIHIAYYYLFNQFYNTIKKANKFPEEFTDLTKDQAINLQASLLVNTLPINIKDQINWLMNN